MTEDQIAHFKKLLTEDQKSIKAEYDSYVGDSRDESEEDQSGELSHSDSNDPGDEGTNLYDRERNMAAADNMGRILSKIERALQKIEDGTYGKSDIDGTPIPIERLEAMPYAVTTVEQEDSV